MRSLFKGCLTNLLTSSLDQAVKEQHLIGLRKKLEKIVPDIRKQYSSFEVNTRYLQSKVRNMHAFQMSLIDRIIGKFSQAVVVDIGDSAGTHLEYLRGLYEGRNIKSLSVNLDKKAVDKIKSKKLEAINARAEDLAEYDIETDIFLCFETLEHLMDPCHFLYSLSSKTTAKYLVLTVPYVNKSRVGMQNIRGNDINATGAESTHIFELSPEDWKLIFMFSGWKIKYEQIYLQYPKEHLLRVTAPWWRKCDFEGFYGIVLEKDHSWSSLYRDW